MKLKTYIASLLLLAFATSFAQVGIGTTAPNTSSMLDITSTNSGLLIPRVALVSASDVTTIASPVTSLLVYNSGFSPNGYYYWNGTIWVQLATVNATNWSLTGNTGTSSSTNFLGTTDDIDIVFKRYGTRAGFIGNPNTSTGNMNTAFGANSLLSPTGTRNVAIGTNVLPSNGSGNRNTAVGERAMFTNTTGSFNTAFGAGTLFSNQSGDFNTAIGRQALTTNAFGLYNTALGNDAGYSLANGSNNIFIGYRAGYNETGSNKLYIEYANLTTDSSPNNALIYGDYSGSPKILRTNSQFQIGNPSVSGYALPTVRGTAGQVLQTDGVGGTSWVTGLANLSVTRTNLSANQALGTGGWQKLTFNTVVFDLNSEFNTGTNRFVAAKAGYYQVNAGYHTDAQSNNQYYSIGVYKNGALYQMNAGNHTNLGIVSRNVDCIVQLAVGDYIEIYAENYQTGVNIDSYSGKTYFEVKQIR